MNPEDKVLSHACIYVHSIDRDIPNSRLDIHFCSDPEREKVFRTLSFTSVTNFVEYFGGEAEEGSYIQSVIGVDETSTGAGTNYVVRLELSELHFYSKDEPIVQDIDPPQSPLLSEKALPRVRGEAFSNSFPLVRGGLGRGPYPPDCLCNHFQNNFQIFIDLLIGKSQKLSSL